MPCRLFETRQSQAAGCGTGSRWRKILVSGIVMLLRPFSRTFVYMYERPGVRSLVLRTIS